MTRAALVVNRRRIGCLVAEHPVQSYGQLACRRHLGHSLGLVVTAMLILFAELLVVAACRLRGFDQQCTAEIHYLVSRSLPADACCRSCVQPESIPDSCLRACLA